MRFITLQIYVNEKLDKSEMLMISNEFKSRTLLTEVEYYQKKLDIKKKRSYFKTLSLF